MAQTHFDRPDHGDAGEQHIAYLDAVLEVDAVQTYKRRAIDLLGLRPGSAVLDVGCGAGADLAELARRVGPDGRVVGVDHSESLLAEARQRCSALPMVECRAGDATHLDVPTDSVDACKADRVLQHVADPSQAFAELVRVARRGGRVVVTDTDWGSLLVAADDRSTTRKIAEFRCDTATAHGFIGRQLWSMAQDAGLADVIVEPVTAAFTDFADADRLLGLTSAAVAAVAAGSVDPDDAARWMDALERSSIDGRFLAALTAFTVAGLKP